MVHFFGLDDQEEPPMKASSEQQQEAPRPAVIPELVELEEYILMILDEQGVKT